MRPLRVFLAAFVACVIALPAVASPDATAPAEVQRFGAAVTVKKSANLAKLKKNPRNFEGKTLRIEGVVKNVCQGAGCWVEVEGRNGAAFIAKSLDESVLLPKDCTGRRIVVQGVVASLPQKDHDHKEHAAEVPHECPAPAYVLSTQGVELLAKK